MINFFYETVHQRGRIAPTYSHEYADALKSYKQLFLDFLTNRRKTLHCESTYPSFRYTLRRQRNPIKSLYQPLILLLHETKNAFSYRRWYSFQR